MATRHDPGVPPPPRRDGGGAVDPHAARGRRPRRRRRRRPAARQARAPCGAGRSAPRAEVSLLVPASSGTRWASPTSSDEDAMFTEADLHGAAVGRRPGPRAGVRRGDRAGDDPGVRPHHRPAGGLADPADGGGARPTPSSDGGASTRPTRRRRRADRTAAQAAALQLTEHRRPARAAARLRLAPAPDRRDLPHGRRRRARAVDQQGVRPQSSGSPTWCPSPRWCAA